MIPVRAAQGGVECGGERTAKLHWRRGKKAPQPQPQQQQRRGGKQQQLNQREQGAGEHCERDGSREHEPEEVDWWGWRNEQPGLPIPAALALSFDRLTADAADTSSDDTSNCPSSASSSPLHRPHTPTAAGRGETGGGMGANDANAACVACFSRPHAPHLDPAATAAEGCECDGDTGAQQVGGFCGLLCLPASVPPPPDRLQPGHSCTVREAADSAGSTDDEYDTDDGIGSSSSSDSEEQEDERSQKLLQCQSCLPPLLSLWHHSKRPPDHPTTTIPPIPPSSPASLPPLASLPPQDSPSAVDFRVEVVFHSIRLLPCTVRTTGHCALCESRLRWYLGAVGSGQAAPDATAVGMAGACEQEKSLAPKAPAALGSTRRGRGRGDSREVGGEVAGGEGRCGGGRIPAEDVLDPVPFHYQDVGEQVMVSLRFNCLQRLRERGLIQDIAKTLPT
ncbi:hypothetical protein CLOM_g17499 [Closterium sp. NIES-68]|nr:hypothetical protein CLOM_g17499 [Closterium sp. NIES-68]